MPPAAASCYSTSVGTHRAHGPLHRTNPTCAISYMVDPRASPTLTAVTTYTRRSPLIAVSPLPVASPLPVVSPLPIVSPLPVVSPLPGPLPIVNLQSPCNHNSLNSAFLALVLTTPQVHPLVAHNSDSRHHMVHYDISKDLSTVCVPTSYGHSTPISDEQKYSLVVEGALHERFRIVFDHPVLTKPMGFFWRSLTVESLLEELLLYFDERVGSRERSNLEKDMHLFREAVDTQVGRCENASDPRAEWNLGMKRVDILGKERKFHGIYLDSDTSNRDYHTLHVVFGE